MAAVAAAALQIEIVVPTAEYWAAVRCNPFPARTCTVLAADEYRIWESFVMSCSPMQHHRMLRLVRLVGGDWLVPSGRLHHRRHHYLRRMRMQVDRRAHCSSSAKSMDLRTEMDRERPAASSNQLDCHRNRTFYSDAGDSMKAPPSPDRQHCLQRNHHRLHHRRHRVPFCRLVYSWNLCFDVEMQVISNPYWMAELRLQVHLHQMLILLLQCPLVRYCERPQHRHRNITALSKWASATVASVVIGVDCCCCYCTTLVKTWLQESGR